MRHTFLERLDTLAPSGSRPVARFGTGPGPSAKSARHLLASLLVLGAPVGCSSKQSGNAAASDSGSSATVDASIDSPEDAPADSTTASDAADAADASASTITALGVRWVGRVDPGDASSVRFAWSGAGFVGTVAGPTVTVNLNSLGVTDPVYFQPVIDGTPGARVAVPGGAQSVTLATGLAGGNHKVELYRETEGVYGVSIFLGFEAGAPQAPPAAPGRLIEIVGDSISAGFGDLGMEQHPGGAADPDGGCPFSTTTESAYVTYGELAGRTLGADVSIVALSGWGMVRDNQNNPARVIPAVYSDILGDRVSPVWGFAAQPQVVVINLGTNDFAMGDPGQTAFEGAYTTFLGTLRGKYPDAWIFCAVGPLLFGSGLTSAQTYIQDVVTMANTGGDAKIKYLDFGEQDSSLGTGCQYHPNTTEHQKMADTLVQTVHTVVGW